MQAQPQFNLCELVRSTSHEVCSQAEHVKIITANIPALSTLYHYQPFNSYAHHQSPNNPETTLLQLFVLDCLNFCFWPLPGFQYEHLASHIATAIKNDTITLPRLRDITAEELVCDVFAGVQIPLAESRATILRQFSRTLTDSLQITLVELVQSAQNSAVRLLNLLVGNFSNFQDHCIYHGKQVHFYKRAQILISDISAKFNRQGLGYFHDLGQLTMFADYRVPQVLRHYKVLQYSPELEELIRSGKEIQSRHIECEIRAASVQAVEMIKQHISQGKQPQNQPISIEIDWFLWELGENSLKEMTLPPHRVLTIYY